MERYFYGNEEGYRTHTTWEGLDDIILMFCEDNYGNMRTLPDEKLRDHKGGLGMYYHLDYHGGPVSYEWINTTPLSKIWEQMTEAYEYGIREVWMVNVGDLKGNEFPLSYFMDLAYDYEKWGITEINSTDKYTEEWTRKQFGNAVSNKQVEELAEILTESVELCHLRRPEAMNSHIYHPAHYHEADRMIERILSLCNKADCMNEELAGESKATYYSLIYHALQSGMNLLLMQIYAGKNEHYAKQGKMVANKYRDLVKHAIQKDRELSEAFGNAFDQKWKGMELEHHIGFTKWNEDGCKYPIQMTVEPFDRPRMLVSRLDRAETVVKNYGQPEQIIISDFMYPGCETVEIEVAGDGTQSFLCQVAHEKCEWIEVNWEQKEVHEQEILKITCKRDMLSETKQTHSLYLSDGDAEVEIIVHGQKKETATFPEMTFLEQDGVIAIYAKHFAYQKATTQGEWKVLERYGRVGSALKAFPVTRRFYT